MTKTPKFLLVHLIEGTYDPDFRAPDVLVPVRRISELDLIAENSAYRFRIFCDGQSFPFGWCDAEDLYEVGLITEAQYDKAQVLDLDAREAA